MRGDAKMSLLQNGFYLEERWTGSGVWQECRCTQRGQQGGKGSEWSAGTDGGNGTPSMQVKLARIKTEAWRMRQAASCAAPIATAPSSAPIQDVDSSLPTHFRSPQHAASAVARLVSTQQRVGMCKRASMNAYGLRALLGSHARVRMNRACVSECV